MSSSPWPRPPQTDYEEASHFPLSLDFQNVRATCAKVPEGTYPEASWQVGIETVEGEGEEEGHGDEF